MLSERQLLEVITQTQARWLEDCQNPGLFPRLLDALMALTDSEYGFIGEVEQTPPGPPYLRMRAFTNIAWSEPLRRRYPAEDPAGIEFHHLDNLFGAVITGGVPVIANAPAQDPRSKGLPAGHPPLHAFLGLPLDSGGRRVGVAGVANRPGGYDEALARALQPFLATCAHLIHAQRLDTQRRQAEAAAQEAYDDLQKSHADLLAILDHLRVGVVVLDADGRVVFLSESGGSLLALHRQSVLGRAWEAAFPFDAESRERLRRLLTAPASARVPIPLTWSLAERACWLEGEVQDDPRHPNQRLVYLYDQSEVQRLRCHLRQARHGDLIGTSEPMRRLYELIERVAPGDWTVLIEGETGVGKELVAHAIHAASPRAHRPFITVNCAGLTESLLTSQLFGHRRGAFTGAVADQAGFFEAAQGGTLFLDEIGDLPLAMQSSLLRAIEEKEIVRLGDAQARLVDVRVLAATHRHLAEEVTQGRFREDLFYRLGRAHVPVPPLRARPDDIPLLFTTLLAQISCSWPKPERCSHGALRLLLDYPWPGNVRELKNVVEYLLIHCRQPVIEPHNLPTEIRNRPTGKAETDETLVVSGDERERLLAALAQARGNRRRAAELLGVSRATFYRRLSKYSILIKK